MTRRHNDANVLALGAGITGPLMARTGGVQTPDAYLTPQ